MSVLLGSDLNLMELDQKPFAWRRRILDAMQTRVNDAMQYPLGIPVDPGGWWHQYVCPEHELPLIFDITSPTLHRCPKGENYQGETYEAAFRVFAHRHYAALARDAAVLYQVTADRQYFKASFEILSGYADLYDRFDGGKESEPWMLTGKAFSQALTEAIWAVPVVQAFENLLVGLSPSQTESLKDRLLYPIAETLTKAHDKLVFEQNRLESNYNAWLISALGCLGYALNDEVLINRAIQGPGGFRVHLNAAILPDSFEYEGSPYYHNFVAWAYTLLAESARKHGVDLYSIDGKDGQSIQQMWSVLASLTMSDGSIPFMGDGNYWQNSSFDAELCEVYEVALARTGDSQYAWLLDCAYQRMETDRDTWAALKFANLDITASPRPVMNSSYLENIKLAILRDSTNPDGLSALLRFGPYGGEHTHLDCLALLLFPCSLDAGNPPYGADTRRSWYQKSAAHNVVIVDGQSQARSEGQLLSWIAESGHSMVKAAGDEIYPGVKVSRQVALEGGQINDHISLRAKTECTFDWLFHTDVAITCEGQQLSPVQGTLFPDGAASFIRLVSQGSCPDTLQAIFEQNGQKYRLTLSFSNPMEIFLARSTQRGGINMDERYTLIARVRSHQTDFIANYEMI